MEPLERWSSKVDASGVCWEWEAWRTKSGYGMFRMHTKRRVTAHRAGWELLVGQPPEGLEPDHLCKNRRCVNPDHLEWVTHRENLQRARCILNIRHMRGKIKEGSSYS